jgi:chromosomal replication initiation ATPase DnaA
MTETIEITKENLETIAKIEDRVCSYLEVNIDDIKLSPGHAAGAARNICIYLIYRNTNLTTAEISDYYERQESMARTAFESVRRLMECVKHVNNELNLK